MILKSISRALPTTDEEGCRRWRWLRYLYAVTKTSVVIDRDIAARASEILGTQTLRETIDAALHEIVNAQRRLELIDLLAEPERFDFSALDHAWGGEG